MEAIAILGGTGPEGLGLALRLAQAGAEIIVGSRDASRASAAAERVTGAIPGARASGMENPAAAAAASTVIVAFPHAGVEPFVAAHGGLLEGKLVIDVVVPLRFVRRVCVAVPVAEGSMSEMIQKRVPTARVVAAFKNLSAEHLQDIGVPLEGDVLVCGEDEAARQDVVRLASRIPDVRGVDAGPLAGARALELLTVLQLNVNRLHHAVTSVRLVGLP